MWSRRASLTLIGVMVLSMLLATAASPDVTAQDVESGGEWPPFTGIRFVDFSSYAIDLEGLTPEDIARLDGLVLEKSIPDLTAAMEAGQLTSYELTLYALYRISTVDVGQLNAVVDLNPHALEIAKARDQDRQMGIIRGPLHGIPVMLKDNITTGDYLYTTAGAAALSNAVGDRDAFLVTQLREAGAIILAKTNMTEWANWMHYTPANGYSAVGGQIVSPYGDWLDPSGSSSGSTVAVTSNLVPLAIGTETIGSIISPSSRASVVGYKPSLGLISRDLLIPITDEIDTAGPIGKTVTDVAIAMTVLAARPDPTDPLSGQAQALFGADFTAQLTTDRLEGSRVGILAIEPEESDEYQIDYFDLWDEVAAFEEAGAEVVIVRPPGFPDLDWGLLFSCDMREEIDAYLPQVHADVWSLADIREFNETHPWYIPYGQERFYEAEACELSPDEIHALGEEARATAAAYMADLFAEQEIDVLVSVDDLFALEYALAGSPAISIPRGVTYDGVPSGLTLVGPYLADLELLGYAYAFEQTGDWRVPPYNVSVALAPPEAH
jgi:amidase